MKLNIIFFLLFFTQIITKNIIISFTTIDSRINYIEPMLKSILNQDLKADQINLYISSNKGILNNGIDFSKLPLFLIKLVSEKKINLINVEDIGPHTKLIYCLKENWAKDCIIITVDDDKIYPTYFIKKLYDTFLKENCVICFRGTRIIFENNIILNFKNYNLWPCLKDKHIFNFAKGVDGVLYKPEFFTELIFNLNLLSKLCPANDDIWFNLNRLIKKIPVYVIGEKFKSIEIPNKKELWTNNKKNNNLQLAKSIKYFTDNNLITKDLSEYEK